MSNRNRCLTYEEEARLRRAVKSRTGVQARRDHAWIRLLLTTGMRITEFSLQTVGDARAALASGYLYVPKAIRKKQTTDLTVHVKGEVAEALRDALTACAEMVGVAPSRLPDETPLVLSRKGGAMTVRAYQQRMKLWAHEAGIDESISPHWLRHTFSVTYVENSEAAFPLVRLSNLLGHASPQSCMHYLTMSRGNEGAEIGRIFPARKRVSKAALRKEYEGRVGV